MLPDLPAEARPPTKFLRLRRRPGLHSDPCALTRSGSETGSLPRRGYSVKSITNFSSPNRKVTTPLLYSDDMKGLSQVIG